MSEESFRTKLDP